MSATTGRGGDHRGITVRAPIAARLRAGAAVLLPAVLACACGSAVPQASTTHVPKKSASPSASPTPSPTASPTPARKHHLKQATASHKSSSSSTSTSSGAPPSQPTTPVVASGCQSTFVPAYFYASSDWAQAIDTRPVPGVMLLNVDSGPGTGPLSHFQTLTRQAQAAGITVLGYSSTEYGQRSISSVEADVRDYKSWYGVNGIFLDLTQGTSGEFSYYQQLSSYIHSQISGADIWLNPGSFPEPSFMSIANVVMVFEGSYASYLSDQVPSWVSQYSPSQFAHVIYATPQSDFASAVSLSRSRRAGHLFVTDLPGSPNPYGSMPSYWSQEAQTIEGGC
jgi:hypothetical protein